MRKLRSIRLSTFDVREGERLRAVLMALNLFLVLIAHYILKTTSRGVFVTSLGAGKLPDLYILIALAGGVLATLYTKVALRLSLRAAVTWTSAVSVLVFAGLWILLPLKWRWVLYAYGIWAQLFGVIMVAQGWLVAANVFNSREAKRLYGLIGLGAVLGAPVGSSLVVFLVKPLGERTLILLASVPVMLAYAAFLAVTAQKGVSIAGARAAEAEQEGFSTLDIFRAVGGHRHLQVIAAIVVITYIVDQLVDFQLQAVGEKHYSGKEYTVFYSKVQLYQNIITFVLQFAFTGYVVSGLGVGGTLTLMPMCLAATSAGALIFPGVLSATVTRLVEAATRYSVNKTAMELLYLPLPAELRNRTKTFVDVFGDRLGRGLVGVLLKFLRKAGMKEDYSKLPLVVVGFTVLWLLLAFRAKREYLLTVRKRLDARRLDLEGARITVGDPSLLALAERAARGSNGRQASYALSLLAEAPGYPIAPLLDELSGSPIAELRGKVYEIARTVKHAGLLERAIAEIRQSREGDRAAAVKPAVGYVLSVDPNATARAREFLDSADRIVVESALESMATQSEAMQSLVTHEWIAARANHPDPVCRRLAAAAIGAVGDQGTEALYRLLEDPEPAVCTAALRAAGRLKNRAYVHAILPRLADPRLRGDVIQALAAYGTRITGTLGDILEDETMPVAIRRQIPRVLRHVPHQRSVDVLLHSIAHPDLTVRGAVLKALNRLRESAPALNYGGMFVSRQILNEARLCFELHAALEPFRDAKNPRTASGLLAASIEERLKQTVERLFRLLGLRYPPKEIYAAYLALQHRRRDEYAAALDFLENVLDRDLKRILLPLLDETQVATKGRDLFGVQVRDAEESIRLLIHSGDSWLRACAMATAAELKLRGLAPDIAAAARDAGAEIGLVAASAQAALA